MFHPHVFPTSTRLSSISLVSFSFPLKISFEQGNLLLQKDFQNYWHRASRCTQTYPITKIKIPRFPAEATAINVKKKIIIKK